MKNFSDLIHDLVAFLRYFIASIVGVIVVLLLDERHDIARVVFQENWPGWPSVIFLGGLGVTIYYVHRTTFHPFVTKYVTIPLTHWWLKRKKQNGTEEPNSLSVYDLAFARWYRRGDPNHKEKSIQLILDEMNAAGHFFYCSGWAILLIDWMLEKLFPDNYTIPETSEWYFRITILVFLTIGFITDLRTTMWDIKANERFPEQQNDNNPGGDPHSE